MSAQAVEVQCDCLAHQQRGWDELLRRYGKRPAHLPSSTARRARLAGRYLNLSDPSITSPWAGVVVDNTRIDGQHSAGRIDFRR